MHAVKYVINKSKYGMMLNGSIILSHDTEVVDGKRVIKYGDGYALIELNGDLYSQPMKDWICEFVNIDGFKEKWTFDVIDKNKASGMEYPYNNGRFITYKNFIQFEMVESSEREKNMGMPAPGSGTGGNGGD